MLNLSLIGLLVLSLFAVASAANICTAGGTECKNGGKCETSKTPYKCNCIDGYTGDTCGTAPTCTADGKECLHGGKCVTSKTPYKCNCTVGYTGATCQNGAVVVRMSAYCVILGLVSYWITARAHFV